MANPSKRKGTAWETSVVRYCHDRGLSSARRNVQHGAKDIGDIGGLSPFAIEAKAEKNYRLAAYVEQAKVEAANAGEPYGVAVVKRHRAPVEDGYVVMDLETFTRLLLDITSEDVLDQPDTLSLDAMFDARDDDRPWVYVDEVERRILTTLPEAP